MLEWLDHLPRPHGPALWFAGAGAVVLIGGAISSRLRRQRRAAKAAEPPAAGVRNPQISPEMRELARELCEMIRRASRALEAQSAGLQKLIQNADQRIARLEAMQAQRLEHVSGEEKGDGLMISLPGREGEGHGHDEAQAESAASRHERIYAYQDQGMSAGEIAEAMGRPAGEIELILALRPHAAAEPPA